MMDSAQHLTEMNSLIKIFQTVQEIWRGHKSVMDGRTDRRTDMQTKVIPIIPFLCGRG